MAIPKRISPPSKLVPEGPSSREWWLASKRSNFRMARWHLEKARYWKSRLDALRSLRRLPKKEVRHAQEALESHLKAAKWWKKQGLEQAKQRKARFGHDPDSRRDPAHHVFKKGDHIRITLPSGKSYTGTVLEAMNWNPIVGGKPEWEIVFKHDHPRPGFGGPGRWDQAQDGGTVHLLGSSRDPGKRRRTRSA